MVFFLVEISSISRPRRKRKGRRYDFFEEDGKNATSAWYPTRIRNVLREDRGAPRIHEEETEGPPRGRRTLTGREASQEDYRKQIISVEILPANSPDTPPRSNVSGLESSSGIAADARAKFPSITAAGVVTIESSRSAQVSRTRRFEYAVEFVRRMKQIPYYI